MDNNSIQAKQRALEYLSKQQKPGGYFLSSYSPSKHLLPPDFTHSVFSNALVLTALSVEKSDVVCKKIVNKLATYLQTQFSSNCTANYLDRNTKEYQKFRYPDDMDDTFCSLVALHLVRGSTSPEVMAKIVTVLTTVEESVGGPYRTWLVSDSASNVWKDIDLVVNINIAYFLKLQKVTLPKLSKIFTNAIQQNIFTSSYYDSLYVMWYFLARVCSGKQKYVLQKIIVSALQKDEKAIDALDLACAINALLVLGSDKQLVTEYISQLIQKQNKDSWNSYGMYIHRYIDGKKNYAGSPTLTTALCIEAITRYNKALSRSKPNQFSTIGITTTDKIMSKNLLSKVRKSFTLLDANQKSFADSILKKVLYADPLKEVSLISYKFVQAVGKKKLPTKIVEHLGVASIFGWIGYTILDNFLDNEADPSTLPLANICIRLMHARYHIALHTRMISSKIMENILTRIDNANYWEVTHCRFSMESTVDAMILPDYQSYHALADKSIGHALGPLIITRALGYSVSSKQYKQIEAFFSYYLIARQLNDDAHDWESDLQRGYLNTASTTLFRCLKKDKKYKKETINKLLASGVLKSIFWNYSIDTLLLEIILYGTKAKEILIANKIIVNNTYLLSLLERPLSAAREAQNEKEQVTRFMTTYKT